MTKNDFYYLFIDNKPNMGRYFGISNSSKHQLVSSYWKGDPWCNLYAVMHKFEWKHTDKIISGAYDSRYKFVPIKENDGKIEMNMVEDYSWLEENNESSENNEEPCQIYNFEMNKDKMKQVQDHCPIWEDGKCKQCGYIYQSPKNCNDFDSTYFMN